jgi:valyl-tRNA synthetase
MVHWCPHLRTVISDIEIEYEDLTESGPQTLRLPNHQDVEFGYIHHFEYEIQNSSKKIQVATTRLETMLGDVAIAVHPEDPRWCSEIGQFAIHPFRPGHLMPIVADETLVDMSTGTGAVKLTPAHDPNDFEAAKRHNLPVRSILDLNARIIDEAGSRYAGRDRFEVREMLENDLSSLGLYVVIW